MEIYQKIQFHKSCSHYFKEGFEQLLLKRKTNYSQFLNWVIVCELNFSSFREIILDVDKGMFAQGNINVQFLFITEDELIPLANYFILKSNYRVTVIKKRDLSAIVDFLCGKRKKVPGMIITEKEFSVLALSLKGEKNNKNGLNPKTFFSRRYSALKKLGLSHFSLLYCFF